MSRYGRTRQSDSCPECGYPSDKEFYPHCSSGCVEREVDRRQEERVARRDGGGYYSERDCGWG